MIAFSVAAAAGIVMAAAFWTRRERAARGDRQATPPRDAPIEVTALDARAAPTSDAHIREYAVLVSIANHSGEPRAIVSGALRVAYRTMENVFGAVDVSVTSPPPYLASRTGEVAGLALPVTLPPGRTLVGWVHFNASHVVPAHCRVDKHSVVLTDDRGRHVLAEARIPPVPVPVDEPESP